MNSPALTLGNKRAGESLIYRVVVTRVANWDERARSVNWPIFNWQFRNSSATRPDLSRLIFTFTTKFEFRYFDASLQKRNSKCTPDRALSSHDTKTCATLVWAQLQHCAEDREKGRRCNRSSFVSYSEFATCYEFRARHTDVISPRKTRARAFARLFYEAIRRIMHQRF